MDFDYLSPFKIAIFFIKWFGLWLTPTATWQYRLYGIVLHLLLVELSTICLTIHMVNMFRVGSVQELSDVMSILFTLFSIILKTTFFLLKFEKIIEMLDRLENLLRVDLLGQSNPHLEADIKRISEISKYYYGATLACVVTAEAVAIFNHNEKRLPYETWFFWDHRTSDLVYWSLVAFEGCTSFYESALNYSLDCILYFIMGLTAAKLRIFLRQLSEIDASSYPGFDEIKLEKCVEAHISLKNFASDISKDLSSVLFLQTFMSSVILCTAAYIVTTVSFCFLLKNFFSTCLFTFLDSSVG